MTHVGVAVLKGARAVRDGRENLFPDQQRANRGETAAHALGDRQQVLRYAFVLAVVQRFCAAHSAHDLVENEQDRVAVAEFAHLLEIARHRGDRPMVAPTTVSAMYAMTLRPPSSTIL